MNASGKLTITDSDPGQAALVPVAATGTYGTFTVQSDGAWNFVTNSAHNKLVAGQQVSQSVSVTSIDGSATGLITINITGSNDVAVIAGTSTASLTETNAALTASGTLSATDVDGAATFIA